MELDYYPKTGAFTLTVHRLEGDPTVFRDQHGLDFSVPMSTPEKAVLFTREPYAAVPFFEFATPAAAEQLQRLQAEIATSWMAESQAHIKVPEGQELWGFQKAGVEYALRRQNSLIGDQPGLGKTMQAIAIANEMDAKRVLVLCPASIRLQWIRKIREWSTMPYPFIAYPILHGRHGVHPTANWTVVSYDLARTAPIWKALAKGDYDLGVLDEAHYLKTIDSQRTRTVFGGGEAPVAERLAARCHAMVGLTGTPLPNRPREAYTLARGLCWDSIDFLSEDRFRERFNPSMTGETASGKIYVDERSGRNGELQSRLRGNFMVRRLKRQVMTQLKMPVLDIVHVEETRAVKQALAAESMLDIDPESLEGADAETLGHISVVRKMMGIAIAPLAVDYIETLLEGGEEKLVVFAWHIEVLNILERALRKYGLVRVDGTTGGAKKQARVDQFRTDPYTRVIIGNLLSLGTGTDGLQEVCTHGVAAEADWTAGNNEQAIDRLDRGGQTGTVQFDFLVAAGSFSERILATSLRKRQVTHAALDQQFKQPVKNVVDW